MQLCVVTLKKGNLTVSLKDLAEEFYNLRNQKDELNEQLKELQKKLDHVEENLLEELGHEGLNRIDLDGIGSFQIASRKYFKIQDRDALIEFLHEQGDSDILSVNHNTLNAYAKEVLERKSAQGVEDFEIPGVSYVTASQIRLRKANGNGE